MFNSILYPVGFETPVVMGSNIGLKDMINYTRPVRIAYPESVGVWQLMNDDSKFGLLSEAAYSVFKGNLLVIGGKISTDIQNRIFYSKDYGKSWQNKKGEFPERCGASLVEFRGFLYLMGGEASSGLTNEIWRSADGVHWLQSSSSSPFTPRKNFTVAVLNDALILTGGSGPEAKEVWKSYDGINWELIHADAPFGELENSSMIQFGSKLFLVGGKSGVMYSNSVYSTENGVDWVLVTNTAFPSGRYGVGLVVISGELVAVGGNDGSSLNAVYFSSGGLTWVEDASPQLFSPRYSFGVGVVDGGLVVYGAANDVYRKVISYEMFLDGTLIPYGAEFVIWDETYHELIIKQEKESVLTRFCTLIGGFWDQVNEMVGNIIAIEGDYTERYYIGSEVLLYNTETKAEGFKEIVSSSFDGTNTLIEIESSVSFTPDYLCPHSGLKEYLKLKFKPEVKFIAASVENFMSKASLKPQGGVIESEGGVDILSDRVYVAEFLSKERAVDKAVVMSGDYKTKIQPMFRIIVRDEFNKVLLEDKISFDFI